MAVQKLIKITVIDCKVKNWDKCLSSNGSIWAIWNVGYSLISGTWTNPKETTISEMAKAIRITIQSIIGITAMIISISSIMNTSSMSSFWSMVNQLQLLLLLMITGAFIPEEVKTVITGFKILLFPSNFMLFDKINVYSSLINNFDFGLSNSLLEPIGISSDSTVFNSSSIFLWILMISLFHLVIFIFWKVSAKWRNEGRWKWFKNLMITIINKIYVILTFAYYIRLILETNQYLLISSIYEIYKFNITQGLKILSLIVALIALFGSLFIIGLILYLLLSSYQISENSHNKLEEFFWGVKQTKRSRVYICIFLIRRLVFVAVLIFWVPASSEVVILILAFLQLFLIASLAFLRPFAELKWNLVEIINEAFFFWLLSYLIHFDAESKWGTTSISIYIWIIFSNNIITFAIMLGRFLNYIFSLFSKGNCLKIETKMIEIERK